MPYSKFFLAGAFALFAAAACAAKGEPLDNGVNDVKAACALRAAWKNPNAEKCINCLASATAPTCECEAFKEFAGLCHTQNDERLAEPSCTTAVTDCAHLCPKSDCTCIDNCYASADACKRAAAATDGCVADVCAKYCQ